MPEIDDKQLSMRPATKADRRFVRSLYFSSRCAEMAQVPWDEARKKAFLKSQFDLQQKHYDKTYPKADKQIVLWQNQPVGYLHTHFAHKDKRLHLIDISLLPEWRGQGVGSWLLGLLMDKATAKNAKMSLYVHQLNPAKSLYLRLGFVEVSSQQGNLYMETL